MQRTGNYYTFTAPQGGTIWIHGDMVRGGSIDKEIRPYIEQYLDGALTLHRGIARWHEKWDDALGMRLLPLGTDNQPDFDTSRSVFVPFSPDEVAARAAALGKTSIDGTRTIQKIEGFDPSNPRFPVGLVAHVKAHPGMNIVFYSASEIQLGGPVTADTIDPITMGTPLHEALGGPPDKNLTDTVGHWYRNQGIVACVLGGEHRAKRSTGNCEPASKSEPATESAKETVEPNAAVKNQGARIREEFERLTEAHSPGLQGIDRTPASADALHKQFQEVLANPRNARSGATEDFRSASTVVNKASMAQRSLQGGSEPYGASFKNPHSSTADKVVAVSDLLSMRFPELGAGLRDADNIDTTLCALGFAGPLVGGEVGGVPGALLDTSISSGLGKVDGVYDQVRDVKYFPEAVRDWRAQNVRQSVDSYLGKAVVAKQQVGAGLKSDSMTGQVNGNHGMPQDYSHSAGQSQTPNNPAASNSATGTASNPSGNWLTDTVTAATGNTADSGPTNTSGKGTWATTDYSSGVIGDASVESGGDQQALGQAPAVSPAQDGGQAAGSPVGQTGQDPAGTSTTGSDAAGAAAASGAGAGGQQAVSASSGQSSSSGFTWASDHHDYRGTLTSDAPTTTPTATHEHSPAGNDTAGNDTQTGSTARGKWEETLDRGAKAINDIVNGSDAANNTNQTGQFDANTSDGNGVQGHGDTSDGSNGQTQDYSHSASQSPTPNNPAAGTQPVTPAETGSPTPAEGGTWGTSDYSGTVKAFGVTPDQGRCTDDQ
ncbi:hypothetical protein ABZ070_30590 [Streptomyces sp. NPDC006283]|uniref:hypothetical protein n=1 Tax=Streptomyces sp. NPDC006283 TaxID=3156741 RepID=UPI0033BA71AD